MANYDADEDEDTGYDKVGVNPSDERDELQKEKLDMMNPRRVQRDNFLDAISQLESSGGKNVNHPVIQSGPQAGQQAMGQYGLLPHTISELDNRNRLAQHAPPSRGPASVEPMTPDREQQYAKQLADLVLDRTQDPYKAAYAWNSGHNLGPKAIQKRDYMHDPYVEKFQKIWKSLGNK